jgi:hypothetical protein
MIKFLFAAVPMFFATTALADTFTPLPHSRHMVDLDTGDGNFSVWEAQDLTGASSLRATFKINRVGADKKWAPTFKFQLFNGEKWVSFTLTGFAGKTLLMPSVEKSDGGKGEFFMTPMTLGEAASLTLSWTPAGALTINLKSREALSVSPSGETHEASLGGAPTKFRLLGSTGEIEVTALELGTTAP